jgi:hypothetical protein
MLSALPYRAKLRVFLSPVGWVSPQDQSPQELMLAGFSIILFFLLMRRGAQPLLAIPLEKVT